MNAESNFSFLNAEFAYLATTAQKAEEYTYTDPVYAAILSRKSLEDWVKWLYDNDQDLTLPADTTLSSLMYEPSFTATIPPSLGRNLHLLRKTGNSAAHTTAPVSRQESLACIRILFDLSLWVVRLYSTSQTPQVTFDESLLPTGDLVKRSRKELEALKAAFESTRQDLERANQTLKDNEAAIKALKERLETVHATKLHNKNAGVSTTLSLTEAETRRLYIDVLLKEAGWDVTHANVREYAVVGMPNTKDGKGKADYVLWGDDGLPLAIIEAKKTLVDAQRGQRQAELYANSLEAMFGRRPVILFSNGFETFIWDDAAGYPPRQVLGFYSKEELERSVNRRGLRQSLQVASINKEIAGRYYQEEAMRRVAARLEGFSRGALLVMATGSGKTRTAAALVDMLTKASWAKRILFLADRNALVTQAKKAFNTYLPQLPAIDLTKEEDDGSNRIIFSTYPTMMNRVDSAKENGKRYYGIGHFDVIIIDEAHRSIYQKYRALFDYFDAIFLGLTATPKADGDRDTYELFGLEAHNPTYAYELDQAVFDKYLVPPKALPIPLKFPRQGVKYNELSEEDKAAYEQDFLETFGEVPDEVSSSAVNTWLFNADTINKVLVLLMEKGQKVAGGDRLGKTIVFAKNHDHAMFIEKCFNELYPRFGGKMLQVIDNKTYDSQGAIDSFADETNERFLIAVSVDMLDTGIDIPDVLNLVFFKPVRSKAKFWQMVGRGTRLRPDIFGPGFDKAFFYIFDVCGNVEFFSAQINEQEPPLQISLTQQLFVIRLNIAWLLQQKNDKSWEESELEVSLIEGLQTDLRRLSDADFRVKRVLREVHKFQQRESWQPLTELDIVDLTHKIAPVVISDERSDEAARRFDLISFKLIKEALEGGSGSTGYTDKIILSTRGLLKKRSIPEVSAKQDLLKAIQEEIYWKNANITTHNSTRIDLRNLMQYVDASQKRNLYTNIEDVLEGAIEEEEMLTGYTNLEAYRKRVEKFLRENQHHLTIHRIRTAQPITQSELNELERLLYAIDGEQRDPNALQRITAGQTLGAFVRSLLGMDINAAKDAFSEFLLTDRFNPTQIHFINTVINALTKNGVIDKRMLFDQPFTNFNQDGLSGVFEEKDARKVIGIIDQINQSVQVA